MWIWLWNRYRNAISEFNDFVNFHVLVINKTLVSIIWKLDKTEIIGISTEKVSWALPQNAATVTKTVQLKIGMWSFHFTSFGKTKVSRNMKLFFNSLERIGGIGKNRNELV